jgi:thiamine biosynthesis lipoprotein
MPRTRPAMVAIAHAEAERIEAKFSRYRADSVVGRIHAAGGRPVPVDEETAQLLDYATELHRLSEGRFDITSGVLRRAWTFDGGSHVPTEAELAAILPFVGWTKATWRERTLTLPSGMEIDLGGIGKEYAVDRAAALVEAASRDAVLVNFGGRPVRQRRCGAGIVRGPWASTIPSRPGGAPLLALEIGRGGLADQWQLRGASCAIAAAVSGTSSIRRPGGRSRARRGR